VIALVALATAHVPLDVGDWTITELDARPAAEGGQWFELRNNDGSDGNNLVEQRFEKADGISFDVGSAVIAHEGEYVVFAADDSPVEADYRFRSTFVLEAEGGSITLVDHASGDIDTVAWTADWGVSDAAAFAVDPGFAASAWANDLAANWCVADGTPGAENAWCPGSDTDDDGDGVAEQGGDCDDRDPARATGTVEAECDGVDQDCTGADECVPDTGGHDTGGSDTGGSDTGGVDTGGVDTGDSAGAPVADTGSAAEDGARAETVGDTPCGCGSPRGAAAFVLLALSRRRRTP
jgi:hypothetical protein